MNQSISIGIVGATAFTGRELVEILLGHTGASISWMTSESQSGDDYREIYPQFAGRLSEEMACLRSLDGVLSSSVDVVFSCLPHGVSASSLQPFLERVKTRVVDLSADFRFSSASQYEAVYGVQHPFPQILEKTTYGLSEWNRDAIAQAQLIGNPGCYPTSILLPLLPLLKDGLLDTSQKIISDSKSGVSGAGRSLSPTVHYVNCNESIQAYKVGDQHRHLPEIVEQLHKVDKRVKIIFTPHLIPMERGILSTIYAVLLEGVDGEIAKNCLENYYHKSPFVHIVSHSPRTGDVKGANHCHIHLYQPKRGREIIILSAIDNLVKGAAGQAVQNMNILFGFKETEGLY